MVYKDLIKKECKKCKHCITDNQYDVDIGNVYVYYCELGKFGECEKNE